MSACASKCTIDTRPAQAVVWQTAVMPVVALELLHSGAWSGAGVLGPESLAAVPSLDPLADVDEPHEVREDQPRPVPTGPADQLTG